MSIILFLVIVREWASICFSILPTYLAKKEGVLKVVLLVLQAHWQCLRVIRSFFLPLYQRNFCALLSGQLPLHYHRLSLLIVCTYQNLYLVVQSYLQCLPDSIVARETVSYPNEPKWTCTLRLWRAHCLSFLYFWVLCEVGLVSY